MTPHFTNENETLATELLHELKASAKRWFIVAMVELFVIIAIVAGFLWYISLPIDEYTYYEQDGRQINTEQSELTQTIGGD